jgi:ABC-type cobalt transport system substrate-binding protein
VSGDTLPRSFCLQAGIGAGIFGFGFGYLFARKKYQKGKE